MRTYLPLVIYTVIVVFLCTETVVFIDNQLTKAIDSSVERAYSRECKALGNCVAKADRT